MLIAARGNPHLPALTDSPIMLVANVLREWGEGGGGGDTTLLNNWGASQIKKFNIALWAWKKFILTPTRYQKEEEILPFKKSQDALQKWGAKKVIFTACHLGKLKLAFTSPDVISTSLKSFWLTELLSKFFCDSNSSKNINCQSGKLKTEFTSPIAKSTSPGQSDTTFFACWKERGAYQKNNKNK